MEKSEVLITLSNDSLNKPHIMTVQLRLDLLSNSNVLSCVRSNIALMAFAVILSSQTFGQTFYLDENGITIKCNDCNPGDSGVVLGTTYTCVDLVTLEEMIQDNNPDVINACTSLITDMSYLFQNQENFNLDISSWDVSNVTNMQAMFNGAEAFNQNLAHWDVSQVESMRDMFSQATSFNQPINSWNVASVSDMNNMFLAASNFNQPINQWNLSNVTDLGGMFQWAVSFNQDISSWDVSNVTNMSFTFRQAQSFNQPLNSWNVSSVQDMTGMFSEAIAFNQPIGSWNVGQVTLMDQLFDGAISFNQNLENWNVSNVNTMNSIFRNASSFNQPLNTWDVSSVVTMWFAFDSAISFNQPLNNWDVSMVISMWRMFRNASSFDQDINSWDVSNVTDMDQMFEGASSFNKPLNNWNVINVVEMDAMFQNASSFNQDIHCWCVDQIPSPPSNFSENSPLLEIYIPNWGMDCTFEGCNDPEACNFDEDACGDKSFCIYPEETYLDCNGECLNDIDSDGICDELEVSGCTDPDACNYADNATEDDGSCEYIQLFEIAGSVVPEAFSEESYQYPGSETSSFEWSVENGAIISGQGTNQSTVIWGPEGVGELCIIETSDECIGETVCLQTVILPTLIKEEIATTIEVYPIPAKTLLTLIVSNDLVQSEWSLYSLQWRHIKSGTINQRKSLINVNSVAPGYYLLFVKNQSSQLKRIILLD